MADGGNAGAILEGVGTLVGAGATAFSAYKSSTAKTPTPKAPVLTPVTKAPNMGDANSIAAKQAELLRMKNKNGRESTILTDENLGS